jgi:hypothetical protein
MGMGKYVGAVVAMLTVLAGRAWADALLVGHVSDLLGRPVPNVRVHVLTKSDHQIVRTDKDGNYQAFIDGNEDVSVVVGAGKEHTFRKGTVKEDSTNRLDFEVQIAEGEIIYIFDSKPFTVAPDLSEDEARRVPPYSDEAFERDAWAKAWLLLDIDEKGQVLRVKLVKRPGFGLDEIAVKHAMKLHFKPALDENGKPMRTQLFWALEWPSWGWMIDHYGTALRMPPESYAINPFVVDFDGGTVSELALTENTFTHVRCAGTGPLNLDERHPVYRDCSKPNANKVPFLPWLDGTQPIPPEPVELARKLDPPFQPRPVSYTPEIAASALTAGLLATCVYAVFKYEDANKKFERFSRPDQTSILITDPDAFGRARDRYFHWQKVAAISGLAAVTSGVFTTSLWLRHHRHAEVRVRAAADGASVTLAGRF